MLLTELMQVVSRAENCGGIGLEKVVSVLEKSAILFTIFVQRLLG